MAVGMTIVIIESVSTMYYQHQINRWHILDSGQCLALSQHFMSGLTMYERWRTIVSLKRSKSHHFAYILPASQSKQMHWDFLISSIQILPTMTQWSNPASVWRGKWEKKERIHWVNYEVKDSPPNCQCGLRYPRFLSPKTRDENSVMVYKERDHRRAHSPLN